MSLEFELPLFSFIFIIVLNIVYFSRRNMKLIENKLYEVILASSMIAAFVDTILHINGATNSYEQIIAHYLPFANFCNKFIITFLIIIFSSLFIYTMIITYPKVKENSKRIFKTVGLINLIFIIVLLFTKIEVVKVGEVTNIAGSTPLVGYVSVAFYLFLSLIVSLINIKKIDRRYLIIFIIVVIQIIGVVVTKAVPGIIIYDVILALLCYIMFFTIENPDLKVIRELSDAKKKAEKYVNEKEIFSFNMSQKIKDPITDIDRLCDELQDTDDIDELKAGIKDIKLSSSKIMYLVSDTLSGASSGSFDIKEEEYNVSNLFASVNQYIKTKSLKYNVNYYDSKYNKDVFVIGDNLKIKQVVCSFALNLIKLLEGQSLTLDASAYNKKGNVIVSFKYIIPDINITLEELNKNEEIDKYENLDFDNISLSKLKKIVNLLDGYIEINKIDDNKIQITINFEQKESIIQSKDSIKFISDYENQSKGKPSILIVDDDEEIIKNINRYKYDIIEAKNGEDCLNMIREGQTFNLIILDENLDKLDTLTVFNKLNAIDNFNIPVIYAGSIPNEESINDLLEDGFTDVLLKPLKQREVDEIINKYIK